MALHVPLHVLTPSLLHGPRATLLLAILIQINFPLANQG
jgi:hypothetical protein